MESTDLELGDVNKIQESVQSLLDCIRKDSHMNPYSPSICMVPSVLRDISPTSFDPRIVSIGPLHREDKNVQAFERKKTSYLINLMSRIDHSPQEDILKSCMKKAYASMTKIKACYVWTKTYGDAEIAKMMVMDACFILEFMHRIWECDQNLLGNELLKQTIYNDLVLLENQIPFFFLDQIFQCTILKLTNHATSLINLITPVLCFHNLFDAYISTDNIPINTTHHILSLLHECYKPEDNIVATTSDTKVIPSAVDLDRAGVNFKPNQNSTWVMGMKVKLPRFSCFSWWCGKPTFRMPCFYIGDLTEFVLRNLIAYEQTFQTKGYFTSYATTMDMLVNSEEDVAKLVDSKVLHNWTGSNEEAANIINGICKETAYLGFYYDDVCETLINYYNGYWPKNIAWLRRTYFNNPWNIIALLGVIVLFCLSVVQTIFTIKPLQSNN